MQETERAWPRTTEKKATQWYMLKVGEKTFLAKNMWRPVRLYFSHSFIVEQMEILNASVLELVIR
jgi:hypothetical protein